MAMIISSVELNGFFANYLLYVMVTMMIHAYLVQLSAEFSWVLRQPWLWECVLCIDRYICIYRELQSLSLSCYKSRSILIPYHFCDKGKKRKERHAMLKQASLSSIRREGQGLLEGCQFYLRGVPLGFHLLLLFFLGQGFVASLSPYPFLLLLFLLGLGFESFFFPP